MVHFTSIVIGKVNIGKGVARFIAGSGGCYIQGINGVDIGDNTMIAPGVKIISSNHDINDFNKYVKGTSVVIGTNCWLGANVVILPEVKLGNSVVVGAGSVVTKSFENNAIIAGNPTKIIKSRNQQVVPFYFVNYIS